MNIPRELQDLDQWVVWKYGKPDSNGKLSKPPYNAKTHHLGKSNDPRTWTDFPAAKWEASNGHQYAGVGFAFKQGDGIAGLDIDYPYDSPKAREVIEHFKGTYCERSPSGHLRIFCYGKPQRTGKGTQDKHYEVYDYTSPRYLTVTDDWIEGTAKEVTEQQEALDWLYESYFKPKEKPQQKSNGAASSNGGISDDEVLDLLFRASNGARARELFDGDWDQAGYPSQSEGDAALCSMLAFYTQEEGQIDRLFRRSVLMRTKWDEKHGSDGRTYGQKTIDFALSNLGETYQGRANKRDEPQGGKKTIARASLGLVVDTLRTRGGFVYDTFLDIPLIDGRPFNDRWDIGPLRLWFKDETGISCGKDLMRDALDVVFGKTRVDSLRAWFERLETWDGESRLDHWLSDTYGIDCTEYTGLIGSKWMISAVARAYEPGCKVRGILCAYGPEEVGKSQSLRDLCPNDAWFSDSLPNLHDKHAPEALLGRFMIEIPEMAAMRRSDREVVKNFLGKESDDYLAKYERSKVKHYRRCVFAVTTNDDDILNSLDDNTRFWPLEVKSYNRDFILDNRVQLWAEAKARYLAGEKWFFVEEKQRKLVAEQRTSFIESDVWDDAIREWLAVRGRGQVTATEALFHLGIKTPDQTKAMQMRVTGIFKKLGWVRESAKTRPRGWKKGRE